jgi:hypothetical protein
VLEALENKEKDYLRDCVVEKGGGPFSWGQEYKKNLSKLL